MHKHKPIFNSIVVVPKEHMKDVYDRHSDKTIKKWIPIAEGIFTELDFDNNQSLDIKLLLFYFEWLSYYASYNTVSNNEVYLNIQSFKKLMSEYINSPSMNFTIIDQVYNPLLKKVRYKVLKNDESVIMDEFYKNDESFLIDLYPTEFLEAIGLKEYTRDRKLNEILDNSDEI